MLGGLHILVSTLKGTLISLTKCGRESEESLEFPLHVVRTLSAAMFGHGKYSMYTGHMSY